MFVPLNNPKSGTISSEEIILWQFNVANHNINLVRPSCKVSDIKYVWILWPDFYTSLSNFREVSPAGTALIHADGHGEVNRRFSRL
jgi:hypothetical protein